MHGTTQAASVSAATKLVKMLSSTDVDADADADDVENIAVMLPLPEMPTAGDGVECAAAVAVSNVGGGVGGGISSHEASAKGGQMMTPAATAPPKPTLPAKKQSATELIAQAAANARLSGSFAAASCKSRHSL